MAEIAVKSAGTSSAELYITGLDTAWNQGTRYIYWYLRKGSAVTYDSSTYVATNYDYYSQGDDIANKASSGGNVTFTGLSKSTTYYAYCYFNYNKSGTLTLIKNLSSSFTTADKEYRYLWYKYNCSYSSSVYSSSTNIMYYVLTDCTACSACPTIDSSTGKFVASGNSCTASDSLSVASYPYIISSDGQYYAYSNMTSSRYKWKANSGNSYVTLRYSSSTSKYSFAIYQVSTTKGSTYSKVSSANNGAYVSDGASGSYYYVYQGSDSIDPAAVSYSSTSPKGGDTLTITVTASSSNTYGGTITYVFSYSTDGGSTWTSLGSTTSTSISMTVPTTISQLQVRVYAKDNYGFTSTTYVYGDNLTVTQNNAPTITSDTASGTDLGTLTEKFKLKYTVNDADGDTVTVSEYLDDVLQRSFTATLGNKTGFQCVWFDWGSVLYGSHTLKAVADDGNGGSATYMVTFTRARAHYFSWDSDSLLTSAPSSNKPLSKGDVIASYLTAARWSNLQSVINEVLAGYGETTVDFTTVSDETPITADIFNECVQATQIGEAILMVDYSVEAGDIISASALNDLQKLTNTMSE